MFGVFLRAVTLEMTGLTTSEARWLSLRAIILHMTLLATFKASLQLHGS